MPNFRPLHGLTGAVLLALQGGVLKQAIVGVQGPELMQSIVQLSEPAPV